MLQLEQGITPICDRLGRWPGGVSDVDVGKPGLDRTGASSDEFAVFQTAGVLLALFPIAELAKDAGVPLREPTDGFAPISLAINVDKPADVDAVIASVAAAGARILRQPSDAFWGGRTAYFADPENNLWEVAWNPSAVFDERGGMVSF